MKSQQIIDRCLNPQLEGEIKFMLNNRMITKDEADFLYRYSRW